ncbi:hypothetical protein F4604DRAFT_1691595 [Suillus subluteus]|nr:hypothetical protein F4604DRAFT_1691595 [Suillus subluteus]
MYKGEFQNPAEVHASRNGWTTLELSMVYMRLQEMLWAKSVTSHGGDQHSMFHPTANRLAGFLLEMSVLFKMRLKLFARNERQMLQWITAPEKAAATTPSSVDRLSAARATYHNLVMKCNVILGETRTINSVNRSVLLCLACCGGSIVAFCYKITMAPDMQKPRRIMASQPSAGGIGQLVSTSFKYMAS